MREGSEAEGARPCGEMSHQCTTEHSGPAGELPREGMLQATVFCIAVCCTANGMNLKSRVPPPTWPLTPLFPTILPKNPAWLLLAFQPLDSAGSSSISRAPFMPFFPSICLHTGRAEPVGREQSKGSRVWKHVRPLILIGADGPLSCWKNQRNVRSFQKIKKSRQRSRSPDRGFFFR